VFPPYEFLIAAENNSTTVIMIPSDFVSLADNPSDYLAQQRAKKAGANAAV
jgi:hypothetical protein